MVVSKSQIKYLSSLKLKKKRDFYSQFIIEGNRIILELINAISNLKCNYSIDKIIISNQFKTDSNNNSFIKKIEKKFVINETNELDMKKISNFSTPPGIVALVNKLERKHIYSNESVLLLDNISNPGNLGTILRSAEWFGIKKVYISKNTVDPYNPKTLQSSAGAHFFLESIIQTNLIDVIKVYKKKHFQIISTSLNGESINSINFNKNWILILGNEGHGVSNNINNYIDKEITINKFGNIESLNVAMAGSIILSQLINKKGSV